MAIIDDDFARHIVESIDQLDDMIDDSTPSFDNKSGTGMNDTVVHSTEKLFIAVHLYKPHTRV